MSRLDWRRARHATSPYEGKPKTVRDLEAYRRARPKRRKRPKSQTTTGRGDDPARTSPGVTKPADHAVGAETGTPEPLQGWHTPGWTPGNQGPTGSPLDGVKARTKSGMP